MNRFIITFAALAMTGTLMLSGCSSSANASNGAGAQTSQSAQQQQLTTAINTPDQVNPTKKAHAERKFAKLNAIANPQQHSSDTMAAHADPSSHPANS